MVTTNMIPGKGTMNFYVHTDDPAGEWSEPIWLDQRGIDPSLLFDDDGKVYFTANGTGWSAVRGAYQSEIEIGTGRRLSDIKFIWPGTGGAYPEAPHVLKYKGYYYLMMAEGGTADCHSVTISRARNPWGPFESCPRNPILSMRGLMNEVQATGHADFVEDHKGNWWAVFLGIRYAEGGFHNLGRETFLAPVAWTEEGWPIINEGKRIVRVMETGQELPRHPWPAEPERDDFETGRLGFCWNFLRNPNDEDWSLVERKSWLRLRCSPVTLDDIASPAFLGRRQEHFECRAATLIEFMPRDENEEAGLTALIDNKHHYEIALTIRGGNRVAIGRRRAGTLTSEAVSEPLADGALELFIRANRQWYELGYKTKEGAEKIVTRGELRFLSSRVAGGYTGVYIGLYASANDGESNNAALFDWFDYQPLK